MHYIAFRTLHYITYCIIWHYIALATSPYIALNSITLHFIILLCIVLPYHTMTLLADAARLLKSLRGIASPERMCTSPYEAMGREREATAHGRNWEATATLRLCMAS